MDDNLCRDVTKSPIEVVDTTSYELRRELASEGTPEQGAWLCDIYEHASIQENIRLAEHLEMDEAYMPQSTSTDKIDEHV